MDKINILLVEDNKADSLLIFDMLREDKENKFKIATASSMEEGFTSLEEMLFDIILLDLGLPDSFGLDTLKGFLSKESNIPIVVFTALGAERTGIEAINMGAQDYLIKDETIPALLSRSIRYSITRHKIENNIKDALKEKELLLRELSHRVKNNLQMISSLINLKMLGESNEDIIMNLKDVQNNIKSLGLIHDQLHKNQNLTKIDVKVYINDLISNLRASFEIPVNFIISISDYLVRYEVAIPLGLIINELVTNSIKHAFKGNDQPTITISMLKEEEKFVLFVSDNGPGLPGNILEGNSNTIGMQLINLLTDQINGQMKFVNNNGTEFRLWFSDQELP